MTKQASPMNRSSVMARVKNKDTKPELVIRRGLHGRGIRYRLHRKELPGRPDITLSRYHAVIEIRGCFWHGHADCGRRPKSNQDFWNDKIDSNQARDRRNLRALRHLGWRVLVVWECAMVGPGRWPQETLIDAVVTWLESDAAEGELMALETN